jgi:hypothetical protein
MKITKACQRQEEIKKLEKDVEDSKGLGEKLASIQEILGLKPDKVKANRNIFCSRTGLISFMDLSKQNLFMVVRFQAQANLQYRPCVH